MSIGGPGKISTFNDSTTALGPSAATTIGIAYPSDATLGGYWLITDAGHKFVVQQIDFGPAAWTGRLYDFSAPLVARLHQLGIPFATDNTVTGMYLGKTVPSQYKSLVLSAGGAPTTSSSSGTRTAARTRPGGGAPPASGTGSSVGAAAGNLTAIDATYAAYEDLVNAPRTMPDTFKGQGWSAPFQWWWQSFTSNYKSYVDSGNSTPSPPANPPASPSSPASPPTPPVAATPPAPTNLQGNPGGSANPGGPASPGGSSPFGHFASTPWAKANWQYPDGSYLIPPPLPQTARGFTG
jgi:hypothetical protein